MGGSASLVVIDSKYASSDEVAAQRPEQPNRTRKSWTMADFKNLGGKKKCRRSVFHARKMRSVSRYDMKGLSFYNVDVILRYAHVI